MTTFPHKESCVFSQVVQVITKSIRSSLRSSHLSSKRQVRKCAQSCKELLDFFPFHTFEKFHSFVLAIGFKNQTQKKLLERACIEAWFYSKELTKNSLIPYVPLLPEEASKQEKFLHGALVLKAKNSPYKFKNFRFR